MDGSDAQLVAAVKRFSSFNFMKNVQIVSPSQGVSDDSYLKNEIIAAPMPPVHHLLNSNDAPSDEERKRIDESLFTARQRLATIQCHAGSIDGADRRNKESVLGRVQAEKSISLIQTFIQTHEAINSSVRTLPFELLQLIFVLCLAHFDRHEWNRRPWPNVSPFPISQVCQRWRQIAHNTPQLWSSLGDININHKTIKKGPNTTFHYIDQFLRRSRGEELSLNISAPFLDATPEGHPVIELLLQHSERWAEVTISSTWITITSILYNRIQYPQFSRNQFSRLRRLGLELLTTTSEAKGLLAFKGAPILEDLYISGSPPMSMELPLEKLRKYRECFPGNGMVPLGAVLDKAKGIERLEIIGLTRIFPDHIQAGAKRLDYLTVLHIRTGVDPNDPWQTPGSWESVESLINILTLPSLEEIKVTGCPGSELVSKLRSLVRRSQCSLRKFYLSTPDDSPRELDLLLEVTPDLEELDIDIPSLLDMYVLAIGNNSSRSDSHVLTELKHLKHVVLRARSSYQIKRCASLVSTIARARFNRERSSESDAGGTQNTCLSPAGGFRLVFPFQRAAIDAQIFLYISAKIHNASPTTQRADSDCLRNLNLWRSKLHEELPELDGMTASAKRKLDLGFSYRLNKLMGEIEDFDPIDRLDLPSLLASKLHISLRQLSQIQSGHILGDSTYSLPTRSRAVLTRWESYLKNDMGNLDWALVGSKSLVFIPEGHALRRTNATFDMIFGIQDDIHGVDLDWAEHM